MRAQGKREGMAFQRRAVNTANRAYGSLTAAQKRSSERSIRRLLKRDTLSSDARRHLSAQLESLTLAKRQERRAVQAQASEVKTEPCGLITARK